MARMFSSRMRIGIAALVAVILLLAGALRFAGAQAGSSVEVISGTPLLAGPGSGELGPAGGMPRAGGVSSAGTPRAALSTDFYNFGAVGSSAVVRKDFLILNRGDAPLRLERAYTTCGCTTAEISADQIPPGKAARVTLTFDAGFHPTAGQTVRRGLILETNDPARPVMEIWVQASVGR